MYSISDKLRVAVLGGGVNGVVSLKYCLHEKFDAVCFEQYDEVGGTWNYSDELRPNQGAACFASLTTNTSKEVMALSDYPMPTKWPQFFSTQMYMDYLNGYIERFNLRPHIQFNTTVTKVAPSADYDATGRWDVTTQHKDDPQRTETFDAVMVCTGYMRTKPMPEVPGLKDFPGTVLHLKDYRTPDVFKGKRVLVIGNRNSAADAAGDAGPVAKQVYLTIGRSTHLFGRTPVGSRPYDIVPRYKQTSLKYLPNCVRNYYIDKICNMTLHQESWGLGSVPAVPHGNTMISDVLPYQITTGRVVIKPTLLGFDNQTAKFSDGSSVDVDMVLVATGFGSDYSFVSGCEQLPDIKGAQPNHYKWMFPVEHKHRTLSFNGAARTFGVHGPWIELQARIATRVFAKKHHLPTNDIMLKDIEYRISLPGKVKSFITITTDYMDELAEELGVYPSFWSLFIRNPLMAFRVFLTPHISTHYRLLGPDSADWAWKEADAAYWRIKNIK